ncbi:MAG: hypothetical protein WAM17_15875 [Rhodoplanes sp.]
MWRQFIILTAVIGLGASALAQDRTVERRAKGPSGANIRIGMYINVKPDCTSGPLPTIRLVGVPENGKVNVKRVNVRATNYRQCLALSVPGYIAFYRSRPGFSGTDLVTLEVKFPNGLTQVQKITVTVAEADRSI